MYSKHPSRTNSLIKTASFVLAVLFFAYTLLIGIAHGSTQENTPWIYDTARISSQSSVSGQYGDYKESYEISLPQGINGLTPSLQLSYSSQNENLDSLVGYGWQLSIPTIGRINKNGTNVLYNRDDYASSLDGEITKINANSYKPVVESGNFSTHKV